jgi:hypothetical protein
MDEAPQIADDVKKLLDRGDAVILYRNQLGSYTAVTITSSERPGRRRQLALLLADMPVDGPHITDDFTPSRALYRLTEKATTGRIAGHENGD